MTLTLKESDWNELHRQAPKPRCLNLMLDEFEVLVGFPEQLGRGYVRSMELSSGVWLSLSDLELHDSWIIKVPAHEHPVQCLVLLSGLLQGEDVYPTFGGERSYFSGSGVSPSYAMQYERSRRLIAVNIELLPEVLEEFLSGMTGMDTSSSKLLLKNNDWKVSFFPTVTAEMRRVA